MASVLERLPAGSRIAVVRLRSLGDCVLTTPALSLLHAFRPDCPIAVAVEDRFAGVFANHPAVERTLPPAWQSVRSWHPRLTLNFHGGTRSLWMTALSGARFRAGFGHHRHSWIYNVRIPRAQEILGEERVVHTAEHLASAMFHLGVPAGEIPRASLYGEPAVRYERPHAVIHPLAATPEKTWPAVRFCAAAAYLRDRLGMEPVFIGAAADDLSAFAGFRQEKGLPLPGVMALLRGASLFLGNDSGPAHMAAAFGVPVAVLFGSSDPRIWGPWKTPSQILTDPAGIHAVTEERVLEAIETLRQVSA